MFKLFRKPTPDELKARHLQDARLELLEAEMTMEAWKARRDMLVARIERLSK
jgi:hypothetical protein